MLNQVNSTMTDVDSDDVFEVTDKNYQRIAKNLENVKFNKNFFCYCFENDVILKF